MHSRRRPLEDWIYTIYSVLTARKGVSAMQIKHELDCRYRTAWYMLHRVREACANGNFKLEGTVEIDEVYVVGRESAKHSSKKLRAGRGTVGKQAVLGMRERGGRVVAKPIEGTDKGTIQGNYIGKLTEGVLGAAGSINALVNNRRNCRGSALSGAVPPRAKKRAQQ